MTWTCLECGAVNPPANLVCGSRTCQLWRAANAPAMGTATPAIGGESLSSKTNRSTRKRHYYSPDFEEFWAEYPRKDDKIAASRAYSRAIAGGAIAGELREAAARYREDPKRDPAFTKYAERWLNAGSYLNTGEVVRPVAHLPKSQAQIDAERAARLAEEEAGIAALITQEGR